MLLPVLLSRSERLFSFFLTSFSPSLFLCFSLQNKCGSSFEASDILVSSVDNSNKHGAGCGQVTKILRYLGNVGRRDEATAI
jgi:hypothetical protein